MINLRYHIVSLIAVFLALAVGIVLGAGPLQARIARSVHSADAVVAATESDALASARALNAVEGRGVVALSQSLTAGLLTNLKVVTVALPGADPADVTSAREALKRAGATLAGAVTLADNWDLQTMTEYRHTLATPLASRLSNIPADATPDDVMGFAIVQILTSSGAERDIASEILTDDSTPIVTVDEDPKGEAHAIVVVGPRESAQSVISDDEQGVLRAPASWNGLARAIGTAPKGGVFIGDATQKNSMLTLIRSLKIPVTTVDQVGTESANLAMVAALPSAGLIEQAFGFGEGAVAAFPKLAKLN